MNSKIENGDKVRDRITGMTGTVTGIVEYITGCNQALVVPQIGADGAFREGVWFDLQRLSVEQKGAVALDETDESMPGGEIRPPRNY